MQDCAAKRAIVTEFLRQGELVRVFVNPQLRGVRLPEHLYQQGAILQIGHNLPIPILDLSVTEDGFTATLSFNRKPYLCVIPWKAVFAVSCTGSERGVLWPQDIPAPTPPSNNVQKLRPAEAVRPITEVQKPLFEVASHSVVDLQAYRAMREQQRPAG